MDGSPLESSPSPNPTCMSFYLVLLPMLCHRGVQLTVSALEDGRLQQQVWEAPMPLSATSTAGAAGFAAVSLDGSNLCFLQTVTGVR